ncbi:phage terminase large subunit family protein, partial [Escherichia coli]|nr:phage terminase large subunit family protein [Escherichia coli]
HGTFFVLPIKGASVYGKPVITMPKKRNQRGVFLCEVGSDTVKEMLYARFALPVVPASEAAPYTFRFPDNPDIFSEEEARQIVAEELVEKVVNGRVKLLWDKKGRRNEALDCLVYAYAALRISVQRWQLDLEALARARRDEQDDDEMSLEEIAAALSGG